MSQLPRSAARCTRAGARGTRAGLAALAATPAMLALASAHALTQPEAQAPGGFSASAGAAGSGSGGAAGSSGWDGLGGGGSGGVAGSAGRDGARPLLHSQRGSQMTLPAASAAQQPLPTTLRRGVHLENGSDQARGDQAGSLAVQARAADLMVTANGSCGDKADQVGVARTPRDRAP